MASKKIINQAKNLSEQLFKFYIDSVIDSPKCRFNSPTFLLREQIIKTTDLIDKYIASQK